MTLDLSIYFCIYLNFVILSACDVLISLPNEMTTFIGTGQMRHERNENDLLVGS